jgi:hypothetical protein
MCLANPFERKASATLDVPYWFLAEYGNAQALMEAETERFAGRGGQNNNQTHFLWHNFAKTARELLKNGG